MPEETLSEHTEPTKSTGWEGIRSIFPSEFQDVLANNCPPNPGLLQTARAFRENPALSLTASKRRIEDIDKQMKTLQGERDRLADEDSMRSAVAEACATICAPARRLPRDVLHEIAHHALAKYPSPTKTDAPMNLLHVSSAWRSVVLHAPRLWADLYLRVKTVDQRSIVRLTQAANAWFRRAGSLPINLFLYVDCKVTSRKNLAYNFSLLLKAIAPWTSRVVRLGIGGQHWINLMTQFADMEWELPNLDTLEILGQRASEGDLINNDLAKLEALASRINLFRTCGPKFTTLIANQETTSYFSAFSFLPWQSFTSVVLKEQLPSQQQLSKFFLQCPRVHSASLCWIELSPDFNTPLQPVPIIKLERLKLEIKPWHLDDLPRFFSAFTFPSLTHLEIDVDEVWIGDDAEFGAIASFPCLSFLRLFPAFPVSYILKFLRNTPKLQTFILDFSGPATDVNNLFEAMVVNDTQRNFLPLLEQFSIQIYDDGMLLDVPTISRFICSRTQDLPSGYTSLKKLSLMGDFSLLEDIDEVISRVLGMPNPVVEIIIVPSFCLYDSLEFVKFPDSFFANENGNCYENLVNHESWLM